MNSVSNFFFTDTDFCKPKVIQSLDLNFNLYLLIFQEVHRYLITLILSKYILVKLPTLSSSIFNKSSHSTEK